MYRHFRLLSPLLLVLLLACTPVVHASAYNTQQAERTITDRQWQQASDDKAFDYTREKESDAYADDRKKVQQPAEDYRPNVFVRALQWLFALFGSGLGAIIMWCLVIAVVCYIIYRLFFANTSLLFSRDRKIAHASDTLPTVEEDLLTTNWEKKLQDAYNMGDLRMATRFAYMWLLQILQNRQLIQYKDGKTNYEYYSELKETSYKQPFRQLSRQYEYTWYGGFAATAAAYESYMSLFNEVKNKVGR